jgi:predicted ATPase
LFTPEVVKAVKEVQTSGFVPYMKERLEEIVDFFLDDEETSLSADTKLEYIKLLRTVENSLEPFSVENGGES